MNELRFLQYLSNLDKSIGQMYNQLVQELLNVGVSISDAISGDIFSFANYPQIAERVEKMLRPYNKSMTNKLVSGMKDAIDASFAATT